MVSNKDPETNTSSILWSYLGPLLSSRSKKLKKTASKKFLYSRKWNFLATKKLRKTFFKFLTQKQINETPLGETGYLSNH